MNCCLTNEKALICGGETLLHFKGKDVKISVFTPDMLHESECLEEGVTLLDHPPKYKFHIRNAFGNYVFFKAKDTQTAQEISDCIFGKKMYTISAAKI